MTDPGVSDPNQRLAQILRAEAGTAGDASDEEAAGRLDRLAETIADMTPAERTWVHEASDDELREFARTLRTGCAPDAADDADGQTAHPGAQS